MSLIPSFSDRLIQLAEALNVGAQARLRVPRDFEAEVRDAWNDPADYLSRQPHSLGERGIEVSDPDFLQFAVIDALIDAHQAIMLSVDADMEEIGERFDETFGVVPEEVTEYADDRDEEDDEEDEDEESEFVEEPYVPARLQGWFEAYAALDLTLLVWEFDDAEVIYVSLAKSAEWPKIVIAARGLGIRVFTEKSDVDLRTDPRFIAAIEAACAREDANFRVLFDRGLRETDAKRFVTVEFTAPLGNRPTVVHALIRTPSAEKESLAIDRALVETDARYPGFIEAFDSGAIGPESEFAAATRAYERLLEEVRFDTDLTPVAGATVSPDDELEALILDVVAEPETLDRPVIAEIVADFRGRSK